ncbi:MAG: hypothetical protein OI74_01170 [Gammaproteobacteria bacterium (ex Lamellibrachia satsuma)]|nr:MAG: iron-sulfur cluster assembly accessory protein [Gammaproteobacteria bacterium (ex Lamellibrachia satsuma)]RRS35991.1 MAG: hypothetical protein OI74_01170 [Gammaproteobacteria bacterium (ex Lamellibrachia satsuma)]RRS36583.1 MAG: hypothetical protein NV67_06840 [Gammaproteobacteria bacterium (ex Lamellibrachia satsuma)]
MQNEQFNHTITDAVRISQIAEMKLLQLINAESDISGIRIFVAGGDCDGMTYGMTFVETPTEFDCVLECNGMNVYVDAVALNYLEGVEIDYKHEGLNKSFVFNNVFSQTGGSGVCGACGAAGGGCA